MKSRLVDEFRRDRLRRHIVSTPEAMPRSAARPSSRKRSHAASTAGTMTAPLCTGPPSKVSSKSSPCAAVPAIIAASSARKPPAWPIAVQGPPPSTLATSARM